MLVSNRIVPQYGAEEAVLLDKLSVTEYLNDLLERGDGNYHLAV
jgi:hypothetical protein